MTTISELKSKIWYRAVKVIYLFFVIACYLVAVISAVSVTYNVYEDKQEYIREQNEINQKLQEIRELKKAGYTTKQITDKIIVPMTPVASEVFREIYGEEADSKYKLNFYQPEPPLSMLWLFLIVPASFLLAWLVSQVPKWIFYYIMLGTMKPKTQ